MGTVFQKYPQEKRAFYQSRRLYKTKFQYPRTLCFNLLQRDY